MKQNLFLSYVNHFRKIKAGQRSWRPTASGLFTSYQQTEEEYLERFQPTMRKLIKQAALIPNIEEQLRRERSRERRAGRRRSGMHKEEI